MSKVGILGGSFDPPHVAHAAMATAARDRLGLDRVLLMPATDPPHKDTEALTPYTHRAAMAGLLAGELEGVELSRFEERREGPSWTVDLLRDFAGDGGDDLYFIVGSDSLADFSTWRDPEGILALCTLVVFVRGGVAPPARLGVDGAASVVVFEEPAIDVSSTAVREAIRGGRRPVEGLVTAPVLSYIQEHRLYI